MLDAVAVLLSFVGPFGTEIGEGRRVLQPADRRHDMEIENLYAAAVEVFSKNTHTYKTHTHTRHTHTY